MAEDCCSTQLIDGEGVFNAEGLDKFVKTTALLCCGLSYAVVAIVGPQSSGKSTLMNHLFYTNFKEMEAIQGRYQTTKGIWIAKCVSIEPFTIAMDVEGTDSEERGQDGATFEKQSSLFALALADVVLINMWCHDIGREEAANKPLIETVFQAMMRLFRPRKTTLLFVIRDKTKTPFEYLDSKLRELIQETWDAVAKPQEHKDSSFNEYFNVEVTALPSYEYNEEQFKEEVAQMRQRFFNSTAPEGLAGDRRGVVPASGFSFSAQQIWKTIKENKDLDSVMVSTICCKEIADEKLNCLASDEGWVSLKEVVHAGLVEGFGEKINYILERYFSEYDKEAIYFNEEIRNAKREQLESRALDLVYPAYVTILWHLYAKAFGDFKNMLEVSFKEGKGFVASVHTSSQNCLLEFEQGCADAVARQAHWDVPEVRKKLECDIEMYASSLRTEKLSQLVSKYEKTIIETLSAPIDSVFEACKEDTWPSIRKLLMHDIEAVVSEFSTSVASFDLDRGSFENIVQNLRKHARNLVEKKAREQAGKVLLRMKDRFSKIFDRDDEGRPRVWTNNENIKRIAENAHSVSLKLLSIMAALRLDEKPDNIESVLSSSFKDGYADFSSPQEADPLASNTWEEVSPDDILITPVQCKFLWKQFLEETEYLVDQAKAQVVSHNKNFRLIFRLISSKILEISTKLVEISTLKFKASKVIWTTKCVDNFDKILRNIKRRRLSKCLPFTSKGLPKFVAYYRRSSSKNLINEKN